MRKLTLNRMSIKLLLEPYVLFFLLIIGSSCEANETCCLRDYPDPESELMKNSGSNQLISTNTMFPEYLSFDQKGRLLTDSSSVSLTKYEYNTYGYLTRFYHFSDVWSYYYIINCMQGDSLYQKWIPINDAFWLYDSSKLDHSKAKMKAYHIMDNGYPSVLVEESGDYTLFTYDDSARLKSKVTDGPSFKRFKDWETELYYYSQSLDSIEIKYGDAVLITKYFSSGILDSVSDDGLITRYKQIDK
ncbi:MAG: hypothetical protein RJQ14_27215 [Marinoscillum sp.]